MSQKKELPQINWWLELVKKDETLLGWQQIRPLITIGNLVLCQVGKEVTTIAAEDLRLEILENIYIPEYSE